jgi:hypothetical protein
MTAKRETELETENRMLREQVTSLEKIIAGMQPVIKLDPVPGCAGYPHWNYWYPSTWQVISGPVNCNDTLGVVTTGGASIQGSTTVAY